MLIFLFFTNRYARNRKRTITKADWCEENLRNARLAIEQELSKRKAAVRYNIPFSTLQKRLQNKNMNSPRMGRKLMFNQDQENEIASQIKLGSLFYGLHVTDL